MAIKEKVEQTLDAQRDVLLADPEFAKLQEFYLEMQKIGVAQKQEYTLPPLDTTGRRVQELTESVVRDAWFK